MIQGRYQHLPRPTSLVIVPYETVMALGGSLEGVAVHLDSEEATRRTAGHLAERFGLTIFSGEADGVFMYQVRRRPELQRCTQHSHSPSSSQPLSS